MAEPLQQRVIERKVYEEIVNIVVNYVHEEFRHDEPARLRIYALIADNFDGMVRALTPPSSKEPTLINSIENGEEPEDE